MFSIYHYFNQKNRNYCNFATRKPIGKFVMCKDPHADSTKKLKAIVTDRIRLMESGEATYIDGEEGFTQIRMRFGL